jgi:hypothetical protein
VGAVVVGIIVPWTKRLPETGRKAWRRGIDKSPPPLLVAQGGKGVGSVPPLYGPGPITRPRPTNWELGAAGCWMAADSCWSGCCCCPLYFRARGGAASEGRRLRLCTVAGALALVMDKLWSWASNRLRALLRAGLLRAADGLFGDCHCNKDLLADNNHKT